MIMSTQRCLQTTRYVLFSLTVICIFLYLNIWPFCLTVANSLTQRVPAYTQVQQWHQSNAIVRFEIVNNRNENQVNETDLWRSRYSTEIVAREIRYGCERILNATEHTPADETSRIIIQETKLWRPKYEIADEVWLALTGDCTLLDVLNPRWRETSSWEADYPLAFSIVAHDHLEQLLRLIASIQRPQNRICVAVDKKSEPLLKIIIRKLSSCPDLGIVVPTQEIGNIYWGHYSILQATMACLRRLNDMKDQWKYVQIISGSDVPLKTNAEMVRIFRDGVHGANDAQLGAIDPQRWQHPNYFIPGQDRTNIPPRWRQLYREKNAFGFWLSNLTQVRTAFDSALAQLHSSQNVTLLFGIEISMSKIKFQIRSPPHNLLIFKGSYANSLTREFVEYLMSSDVPKDFYAWANETFVPDELFFSTLIHNDRNAPGYFDGKQCFTEYARKHTRKPFISRFDIWSDRNCHGKMVRRSCVFGVNDLPQLVAAQHLFAHKFYPDFQPATYFCLLQRNLNKDLQDFDLTYYKRMPTARFERLGDEERKNYNCN